MRIFIGLTEVSGYYRRLQRGLSELGVQAEFFPLQEHRFGYGSMIAHWVPRMARWCVQRRINALGNFWPVRLFWLCMVVVSRTAFLVWALTRFDVFFMGGGSSFFQFRELWLMRLLGRRIVYTFHGTDCRPAWMDGFCQGISRMSDSYVPSEFPTEADLDNYRRVNAERLSTVRRIERYANIIINAPPQAQLLTKPYVLGLAVGIPVDDVNSKPSGMGNQGAAEVRILHSPSFHIGKGTAEIRAAIQKLQRSGVHINYTEINNRPHMEVRDAIAACDFVVDQVYSDSPMAGFAAEAAIAGKPAVVCGYYSTYYEDDLAPQFRPPSLYCQPEQLEKSIRTLATDATLREHLGATAQRFVRDNWSPQVVAQRYLKLASDEPIPPEWIYFPDRNRYFFGMGIDKYSLRNLLRLYLKRFGDNALGINATPELKHLVLAFASQEESCTCALSDATH